MGTLTLLEIRTEIKANLQNRDDISDTRIDLNINLASMRIARKRDFEEMKRVGSHTLVISGTPATDKFLNLNKTVREVYSLRLVDGTSSAVRLTRVSQNHLDTVIPEPHILSTGQPSVYILENNTIEFWKVPDSADQLLLRWSIWPTALSADGDISDLDEKDDMIISLTTSTLKHQVGNEKDGNKFFNMYADMIRDAIVEDEKKPDLLHLPGPGRQSTVPLGTPWADPFVRSL